MQNNYETARLSLNKLNSPDAFFILKLVNTPGWISFIGDRKIHNIENAHAYIRKLTDNPNIHYWVVTIRDQQIPIGVVTFIKRDYLEHYDIGFAFLPDHNKQGFAREATSALLLDVINDPRHSQILATTVPENINSIRLLEKLGLRFNREIVQDNETLLVYAATIDKLLIDHIIHQFFSVFTNSHNRQPNWDILNQICLPETVITKKNGHDEEIYNLSTFIAPRKKILSDNTLTEFEENETQEETTIGENIAQRHSRYQKKGFLGGKYFEGQGNKFFQLIKTNDGWKINSITWEDDAEL